MKELLLRGPSEVNGKPETPTVVLSSDTTNLCNEDKHSLHTYPGHT